MKSHVRGAALLETALFLPVLLIALYGVTWGVRVGAISERAESAVRYAGVISQQQSPFNDYSFYALYNNLGATNNVNPEPCQSPPSSLLLGGDFSVVPGTPTQTVVAPTFWQPDPSSVKSSCKPGSNRITIGGSDLTRAYIMLLSQPQLSASVSDIVGNSQLPKANLQTSTRFYRSPDIATLMHCESGLSNPVSASLQPPSLGTITSVPVLTSGDLTSLATIGATANCANPPTYQTPPPAPSPSPTTPGSTVNPTSPQPSTSPSPSGSPTPTSSAAPSAGPSTSPSTVPSPSLSPTSSPIPATPKPSATPSPVSTATANPGPTANPSSSPTVKPSSSPTANPSSSPTAKPSSSPTAKPSSSPSGSPSPSPSPTSNGTVS